MKKYYVVGRRQLELRDETLAEPGPGEVLIRTRVSALSVGTEVWRYVNGGHYGGEGSACGYNSAGVVVAVGPGVTDVQTGDAVFAAQPHAELREPGAPARLQEFFGSPGPDVIVETSQAWQGRADAVRLAHPESRIAIVGIYRTDPTGEVARDLLRATFMDRDRFHNQHLRFIGCSNDPADDYPAGVVRWTIQRNMQYIADQIAAGRLAPTRAITHRVRWDELECVYERVAAGDRGMVGVTLHWD